MSGAAAELIDAVGDAVGHWGEEHARRRTTPRRRQRSEREAEPRAYCPGERDEETMARFLEEHGL